MYSFLKLELGIYRLKGKKKKSVVNTQKQKNNCVVALCMCNILSQSHPQIFSQL